jgi:methionyl-tRNA formyltransferase
MKKISETIVFFGSGPVAARSLELLAEDFTIEAVITKPKPTHHKGDYPVLPVAEKYNLQTHTAGSKLALSELFAQTSFRSRIGLVIDYGVIIQPDVIDSFPLGILNSHFSLLPQWRGADPLSFAILSGQEQTGVSLMRIDEKMDEGPLLAQATYDIPDKMTTPALTDALIELSHYTLHEIIPLYLNGEIEAIPQEIGSVASEPVISYSRKLQKSDGIIDWRKPAEMLEREIRAYIDWPKSRSTVAGKDVIITDADVISSSGEPGDINIIDKQLIVYCGSGALRINKLKPSGKKEMAAQAFLAGHDIA